MVFLLYTEHKEHNDIKTLYCFFSSGRIMYNMFSPFERVSKFTFASVLLLYMLESERRDNVYQFFYR